MEEDKGGGKEAVKFKTWIQVAAAGVLGIIQLAVSLRPETASYGVFSIIVLAVLIIVIVYSDYKTGTAENELRKAEIKARKQYEGLKNEIPMIELTARKKGAEMALEDAEKSFREDAKSARSTRTKQIYVGAARLVSRQRRLLEKMQEIARR
jgi:amino acid permease